MAKAKKTRQYTISAGQFNFLVDSDGYLLVINEIYKAIEEDRDLGKVWIEFPELSKADAKIRLRADQITRLATFMASPEDL
jgi:hypothetical protein